MIPFDFKRSSRKCSITGREFQPGETYVSAVFQVDDGILDRRDFALDQWSEPPDDCVGWWKCTVPVPEEGKVYWAPRRVLISYFESLFEQPGQEDLLYVTALVLVQRKVLKVIGNEKIIGNEPDDHGSEWMIVFHHKTRKEYRVPVVDVAEHRVVEIQDELSEKLFTDRLDDIEDVEDGLQDSDDDASDAALDDGAIDDGEGCQNDGEDQGDAAPASSPPNHEIGAANGLDETGNGDTNDAGSPAP